MARDVHSCSKEHLRGTAVPYILSLCPSGHIKNLRSCVPALSPEVGVGTQEENNMITPVIALAVTAISFFALGASFKSIF